MNRVINFNLCFFFLCIIFLLFYGLDERSLRLWDEARLAMNAMSMVKSGNYFYTAYQLTPDFWNTKPHLLILLQVFSMKLFGFTESSIRLPSALAALFSCGLIYHWMKKEKHVPLYGCVAVLAFICTRFLTYHGARAGDYEALLILWQIAYCYAVFQFVQTQKKHFLFLSFLSVLLAVMTKGIAGLLFVPGIVIFVLVQNKLGLFLKSKSFYLGLIFLIFSVAGYYYGRENLTPGYIQSVLNNEIGGRFLTVNEGHQGHFWFYINLFSWNHFYFMPLLVWGVVYLIGFDRALICRNLLLQYTIILFVSYFVVISFSKTKLEWYAYPLYPWAGLFVGVICSEFSFNCKKKKLKFWIYFLSVFMMFSYGAAVISMLASNRFSKREKADIVFFLKRHLKDLSPLNYKLVVEDVREYDASLDFQVEKYQQLTKRFMVKINQNQVREGDWVIMKKNQSGYLNSGLKAEAKLNYSNEVYDLYQVKVKK